MFTSHNKPFSFSCPLFLSHKRKLKSNNCFVSLSRDRDQGCLGLVVKIEVLWILILCTRGAPNKILKVLCNNNKWLYKLKKKSYVDPLSPRITITASRTMETDNKLVWAKKFQPVHQPTQTVLHNTRSQHIFLSLDCSFRLSICSQMKSFTQ